MVHQIHEIMIRIIGIDVCDFQQTILQNKL